MTRRDVIVITLTFFLLGAGASGHEEFRIIGTVTKVDSTQLQVKNKEGKIFTVAMTKYTHILRDKKKVEATELRVGRSIVVDAVGDTVADLTAMKVTIVPAIGAPTNAKPSAGRRQ